MIVMPQPSPRFQTVSKVGERGKAPTVKDRQGSFKGFKIPARAREQLSGGGTGGAASGTAAAMAMPALLKIRAKPPASGVSVAAALADRTNSPPEAK
jgi:hypothetical protein